MPTLLDEIIDLATDDKQPLTVVLRKCLVLSHQLKNESLKAWANQELSGYPFNENLPLYRNLSTFAVGDYTGPFNSSLSNMPIPSHVLREEHRHWVTTVQLRQSIGILQDMAKTTSQTIRFPWPADLVVAYQSELELENGMVPVTVKQLLATSAVAGVLETVRNRTLSMALELQTELDGHDLKTITPAESVQVERTITNIIYGGNNVIASGNSNVTANISSQQIIKVGSRVDLDAVLKRSGLSEQDLKELSEAEKSDGQKTMGSQVMSWIKKTAPKVLAGGVKIGAEVGQKLLSEWLKQYFGVQ